MSKYLLTLFLLLNSFIGLSQSYTNWTEQSGSDKKYIALIIANDEYEHVGRLQESVIMATDLEDALGEQGFDVLVGYNQKREGMVELVKTFSEKYTRYGAAMVFFLGHGVQVEGENYLVPVEAKLSSKDDIEMEAVHLDYILKKLNNPDIPKTVFLDACRNNPFKENWLMEDRALVPNGLAEVKTPSNVEVYLTTSKDNTVPDDNPYLTYFIEELEKGGCLYKIIPTVTRRVIQYYNGRVTPDRFGVLLGDVCFGEEVKNTDFTSTASSSNQNNFKVNDRREKSGTEAIIKGEVVDEKGKPVTGLSLTLDNDFALTAMLGDFGFKFNKDRLDSPVYFSFEGSKFDKPFTFEVGYFYSLKVSVETGMALRKKNRYTVKSVEVVSKKPINN